MRILYLVILSDIEPVEFRNNYYNKGLVPDKLTVVELEHKPDFLDALIIEQDVPVDFEWKHVLKVKEVPEGYEVIEFPTSFGKSFGNVELIK